MSTERPTLAAPSHPAVAHGHPARAESRPGVWVSTRTWLPTDADLAALTNQWQPADWPQPPASSREA
jgi:hypothetical protein